MIIVLVKYECKENCAKTFLDEIRAQGIDTCCRNEEGNLRYEYSYAAEAKDVVVLTELWSDQAALDAHAKTEHIARLGKLKAEYVNNVVLEKYEASKL